MENYLSYLHNTLGLEHIILHDRTLVRAVEAEVVPAATATEIIEHELHIDPRVEYHFQIVNADELTAEEHELFHKIMEALKLPSASYIMTSGPTEVTPKAPRSVIFTDFGDRYGDWIKHDDQRTLRTYSLQAMLLNPDLKKSVWSHLKQLKLN